MSGVVPANPKLYHIVHIDRLPSIIAEGRLLSDAGILDRAHGGTVIGMNTIKTRRLRELTLSNYPDLHVGECVPFYFCPRSVMLYLIHQGNHPDLGYRGGQDPIIHLQADFTRVVEWAGRMERRWVFTLSNAGAYYFEDRCDPACLGEIDWEAVQATNWRGKKEGKQAEFLLEREFPQELVESIGVRTRSVYDRVAELLHGVEWKPRIEIKPDWYY